MAEKTKQILIESILGGHSPTTHFSAPDQFRASLGIDPGLPAIDHVAHTSSLSKLGVVSSGLLRPTPALALSGTINKHPLWIKRVGKQTQNIFIYDAQGSVYNVDTTLTTVTGLSDGGSMSNSSGNGMGYNDNYVYFAKNTTIARYGPLNGTPAFDGDYWVTTLGKASLTNPTTPTDPAYTDSNLKMPNHVMHRHSDGRLYFADVVDNKATLHFISTTKTTVEGDTDNGSTYSKLQFGYGLKITALESYGSMLAIAMVEWENTNVTNFSRAKLAFWDTTSNNFNNIIWVEFPDGYISALKNINGILYATSSNGMGIVDGTGFRVSRFVGGYTFEEVANIQTGTPPFPGAIDGDSKRLLFGSYTVVPEHAGCVYSLGLQKASLSNGLFNTFRITGPVGTGSNTSVSVYSLMLQRGYDSGFHFDVPFVGWANDTPSYGIDRGGYAAAYGNSASVWWSRMYRFSQPFKITKIRIPFVETMAFGATVTPKIYVDDGDAGFELNPMNTTYFNGKKAAVYRPQNLTGNNNFWLELRWTGTARFTISLPIVIEYELLDE